MNRPRGTRDFGPDEMAARDWAAHRLRAAFTRFGYKEVQTPTFEELELFTAKSGQGIKKELYDFVDKGGRHLTLRPELTAPVMRMYYQEHAFDPKPIKWFYHGPCFRYDRPQAGRYREFWQFGCEQIGAGTPLAYAELIALADAMFDAVGLRGRDLAVGHVAVLRRLVDGLGLAEAERGEAMRLIDKKDLDGLRALVAAGERDAAPAGGRRPAGGAARAGDGSPGDDRAPVGDKAIGEAGSASDTLGETASAGDAEGLLRLLAAMAATTIEAARAAAGDMEELDELEACLDHLDGFGTKARLDLGIARGLDYYTGIVFECHSPALGAQSQLLGGGGYDLSAVFGGQPTPTMGFGLGFDRTLVALEAEGRTLPAAQGPWVYAGALGAEAQALVTGAVAGLRRSGVTADMDLLGRKPGQIAKAADAAGARFLLIVGQRDLQQGRVEVKDLRNGASEPVAVDDVKDWLVARARPDLD